MGVGVAALVALLALPALIAPLVPGSWRLVHVPLHSLVESLGCAVALGAAGTKFIRLQPGGHTERSWLMSGVIAMGLLLGLHAATTPGDTFLWLQVSALCVGGLLSAMIWLPGPAPGSTRRRTAPFAGLLVSVAAAAVALGLGEVVNPVADQGTLAHAAAAASAAGGLGFLAAGVYLLQERRREEQSLGLEMYCLAMAAAGLAPPFTAAWGGGSGRPSFFRSTSPRLPSPCCDEANSRTLRRSSTRATPTSEKRMRPLPSLSKRTTWNVFPVGNWRR